MMKKLLLFMMGVMGAMLPATAQGTLTVYDGNNTNSYVPIYGYYMDAYLKCEYVIPATDLTEMVDGTITSLKWYLSSRATTNWGACNIQVFLKEVENATLDAYSGLDGATIVFEGPIDASQIDEIYLDFINTPYVYHGGNLLVGVYNTAKDSYGSCSFYGVNVNNVSVQGHNYSSLAEVSANQRNFGPKTTFEYVPSGGVVINRPTNLTVSNISTNSATLSWTAGGSETSWNVAYKKATDENWIQETVTTTTYVIDPIDAGYMFDARVQAVTPNGESGWTSTQFSTPYCDDSDKGSIAFSFSDTFGDSWSGNKIQVVNTITGSIEAELTCPSDIKSPKTYDDVVNLCYDTPYNFVWVLGSYPSEVIFSFTNPYTEEEIFNCQSGNASNYKTGDILFTYTLERETYPRPKDLTASNVTYISADLSWTAGGEETAWQIVYDTNANFDPNGIDLIPIDVTGAPSHTLENLTPETTYYAYVRANYGDGNVSHWSNLCSFTTPERYPRPTGLTASNVTYTSANLSWTANGTETAWQIVYDTNANFDPNGNELISIDVASTSATLTGLTPDATYYAYVRAKYHNEVVSLWSDKCSFTTPEQYNKPTNLTVDDVKANQVTLSWEGVAGNYNLRYCTTSIDLEESFEEGLPSTWTTIDNNGDGNNWMVVNSSTYFSDGSFPAPDGDYVVMSRSYVNGQGITPDNWLITPKVPLGGELSYYIMDDGSFYETYRIYVSTTGTDVADFIPVTDDMHSPSSQNWTPVSVNLNDFAGQEGYIAFRHYNCTDRDFMFIDDIKLIGSDDGEWTVVNDKTSPATITGLTPETYYLAEAQAVYDEGISSWTAPVLFYTLSSTSMPSTPEVTEVTQNTATVEWSGAQESYNLRYRKSVQKVGFFEDFESGTLDGWTNIDQDGDGYKWNIWDPTANNLTTDDKNGNLTLFDKRCATSASYVGQSALTPDNWLISPQVELKGSLSVWLRAQDPDWTNENFAIYASTTGTDIDDFTVVLQDTTQSQGVLTEYTADLSQFNGQMGYIAIRHFNCTNAFRLNVDNFHVKHAEDIPAEEWIVVENVTSPYIITGLDPNTKYDVEVQGIINDGSMTDWTPTVNFKTVNAVTLPEALAGRAGDVLIISDMKVMISTSDFASATDGDGNWIILFASTPLTVGDVITNVVGKITLGANPMLNIETYEPSDAVIDVPEKKLDLANIHRESITELKPGEMVSFLGYYNTSTGEICAFSPETEYGGLHIGVSTYYMTGSVVEGKQQKFTGMAYLREAWDAPSSISAHAPARVAIDDDLAFENVYAYITEASNATGVEAVKAIDGKEIEGIYNVNGQQVSRADKGVYIIRYTDGTTQKVRF